MANPAISSSLEPMVELLQEELEHAGLHPPVAAGRNSPVAFSRWYLQVVEQLEAHVATKDDHAPMSRDEVELMCRCALSTASLGEAMATTARFTRMLDPRGGHQHLEVRVGKAYFVVDTLRGERSTASSLVDIAGLFAFKQLFRWLAGGQLALRQVGIGPTRRADVMPFLRLFGAPVLTGGEMCYLAWDEAVLAQPVLAQPGQFDSFFEVFPCAVFDPAAEDLVQQIAAMISASVRQYAPVPGLRQVAGTLGLPPSTLRRRLSDRGTGFRRIREQCLQEAALDYLANTQLSPGQLALRLGFQDSDSFRSAFRRWTGRSPSAWRREQQAGKRTP